MAGGEDPCTVNWENGGDRIDHSPHEVYVILQVLTRTGHHLKISVVPLCGPFLYTVLDDTVLERRRKHRDDFLNFPFLFPARDVVEFLAVATGTMEDDDHGIAPRRGGSARPDDDELPLYRVDSHRNVEARLRQCRSADCCQRE